VSVSPKGWALTTLEQIGKWGSGGTPKRTNSEYYNGDIPWLVIGDLNDGIVSKSHNSITQLGIKNSSAKLIDEGTLLVAMYGSIGKLGITGFKCATNQAIASCVVNETLVDKRYLFYYLKSRREHLLSLGKGGAQQNISQTVLKAYECPLAPLNEQKRIADKLDSILAKVGRAQARLDKIPGILKRFRQSVLAAATLGELSPDWREQKNIDLASWSSKSLGDLSEVKTGSTPLKSNKTYYENGDIPWLTSAVTGQSEVTFANSFVTQEAVEQCRLKLFAPGTLLVAMYGEGKTRGQVTEIKINATINQACAAIEVNEDLVEKQWVKICLLDNYERTRMMAEGGAQPNLNLSKVRSISIPLPTFEEQRYLVATVNSLIAKIEAVEKQFLYATLKFETLTKSILSLAFCGKLVNQDPTEEPASDLIQRIQSSNADIETKKIAKPKTKISKVTKPKIAKQTINKDSEQTTETLVVALESESHATIDRLRLTYQNEIKKAHEALVDAIFSLEQFRSITDFKGNYEELKVLIMNLLKGIPNISEPLLTIESWDDKSGDYLMRLLKQK
jgi:type I restriction enzyme S subunit